MTAYREGDLIFEFPEDARIGRVDAWAFYRRQFSHIAGSKAVDFVCVYQRDCWLIEVKDYRSHKREKASQIWDEVAGKARDTLACLAAARLNAKESDEKDLAHDAVRANSWRVALHLEQRRATSRLHRGHSFDANLMTKLKRVVKGIDPHPVVASMSNPRGPWWVTPQR